MRTRRSIVVQTGDALAASLSGTDRRHCNNLEPILQDRDVIIQVSCDHSHFDAFTLDHGGVSCKGTIEKTSPIMRNGWVAGVACMEFTREIGKARGRVELWTRMILT
jgi:hypothetical protein